MPKLHKFRTTVFQQTPIAFFDAPSVSEIVADGSFDEDMRVVETSDNTFKTQVNVKRIPLYTNNTPDFQELLGRLPEECFETDCASESNRDLFLVDNCLVFPPNILYIAEFAYINYDKFVFHIFGQNVEEIEDFAFQNCLHLRKVFLPNLCEMASCCFYNCVLLQSFIAPNCREIGHNSFSLCKNLTRFVAQPRELQREVFQFAGIRFLDLPSVIKVEDGAFSGSLIEGLKLENCVEFEENALENSGGVELSEQIVRLGSKNARLQLFRLKQIVELAQLKRRRGLKQKMKVWAFYRNKDSWLKTVQLDD